MILEKHGVELQIQVKPKPSKKGHLTQNCLVKEKRYLISHSPSTPINCISNQSPQSPPQVLLHYSQKNIILPSQYISQNSLNHKAIYLCTHARQIHPQHTRE